MVQFNYFDKQVVWKPNDFSRYHNMVIESLGYVEHLVYDYSKEGLHLCCHLLTGVAKLQHAFLTSNMKLFKEICDALVLLCVDACMFCNS